MSLYTYTISINSLSILYIHEEMLVEMMVDIQLKLHWFDLYLDLI